MPDIIGAKQIQIVKKSLNEYARLGKYEEDILFCRRMMDGGNASFEGRNASAIKTALRYFGENGADTLERLLIDKILLQPKWDEIESL